MIKKSDISINLFGLAIFSKDKSILLKQIETSINNSSKLSYIFTPNPEQVIQSRGNSEKSLQFLRDLQTADLLLPDGIGLVWASRYLSLVGKLPADTPPIQERIAGAELVTDICRIVCSSSPQNESKVLIIGGRGYSDLAIEQFRSILVRQTSQETKSACKSAPQIKWISGYEDVQNQSAQETQTILKVVEEYKPQVLFVAFGAPHQERWLIEHRPELEKAGVKLGMAVGGSFDYLFGIVPRAPKLVQALGGEWLFRLLLQPWRITRQLRLVRFMWLVLFGDPISDSVDKSIFESNRDLKK